MRMLRAVVLVACLLACVEGKVLLQNPMAPKASMKGGKVATGQALDSHFWGQSGGETYDNHQGRFFRPSGSDTFSLIKLNNVNVTFLDNTNLRGYDGADMATLGKYKVKTRMGMIEHCNSRNFDDVDGILGFGWADQARSAALLKTLTQPDRPGWDINGQPFAGDGTPMPRRFAFTANNELGELHLGGYDPAIVQSEPVMMRMTGRNVYGIDIHSITYGGVELLRFDSGKTSFVGEFDSGTTCLLLPNTDVKGNFTQGPFGILAAEQAKGRKFPLVYHVRDLDGQEHRYEMSFSECVEPTDETMILGDPWFRKFVVMHDLEDLHDKKMGLAPRATGYQLGANTDRSILTPGHAPGGQLAGVSKVHARRTVRGGEFTRALKETKRGMAAASELHERDEGEEARDADAGRRTELSSSTSLATQLVDKVAVKSQSMVTYNIQLAIGTPPQPLDVIFDTGSFMLAVFAEAPPAGMQPLLKSKPKKAKLAQQGAGGGKAHASSSSPADVAAKVARHVKAHVSREDRQRVEELAQTAVGVLPGTGRLLSGGMVAGVFAACAVVLAALGLAVRRRRRVGAGGVEGAGYGSV